MNNQLLLLVILLIGFYLKKQLVEGFSTSFRVERPSVTKVVEIDCDQGTPSQEVWFPAKAGQTEQGQPAPAQCFQGGVSDEKCDTFHASNLVYYPRYRGWFRYIHDLKTRPEYDRIYPPFWNTHYDPNITSDIYYEKVAADHIMPLSRKTPYIKKEHDQNFYLRQELKFSQ